MKFSVIVIAVWMQSYIEPGLIEVSSESTACAIFAKFHETWRSDSKILAMVPYGIYPEIIGTNIVVQAKPLTCPSGFDFSQVIDEVSRRAKTNPGHKPCEAFSAKKDWKSYFSCVANWMDK